MSWIGFLVFLIASKAVAEDQLILSVGQTLKIPARGELVLGSSKVLRATDLGRHFQLEAVTPGAVELRNGEDVINVSVLTQKQFRTQRLLEKETLKSLGLKVVVDEGDVVLTGKILTLEEWKRIARVCRDQICRYKSRFQTPSHLRVQIQKHFSEHLQSLGYGTFRLRWEPEIQILVPSSQKTSQEIEKISSAYGISVIQDAQALELAPSIRVQITILEVKKAEAQKYGIQWPASYSAQLIPKAQGLDQFLVSAHFLEQHGLGRILASPSLLCRSGKEAEFLAGGEIPIKILNYKLQDVVWKKYGILLKIRPQADFSGRMSLAIETEVSSIDTSHTSDGIPGFYTNRVQSHFDLTEPRTVALSGLIKSEEGDASQGVLGLSKIPILGTLFSSRDFQQSKTELVILVRPELVTAIGEPDETY
jgi:pilus assembly protein CpaC